MLEPGTWRGAVGVVKHAYLTAAEVVNFVITFDRARPTAGSVVGTVTRADPYLLTQTPLVFMQATQYGAARWPIESVTVTEDRLTARLGPMEGA